jgi:hypothetical protein
MGLGLFEKFVLADNLLHNAHRLLRKIGLKIIG